MQVLTAMIICFHESSEDCFADLPYPLLFFLVFLIFLINVIDGSIQTRKNSFHMLPCLGRTPYEHSRVAKYPLIKHVFLATFMHIFPRHFQIFLIKLRTKLLENFRK